MRPIKLTISAFGPYASKQVIDFEELNGRNIFVISGKTGSGKTTIFDAISYALYGEASGDAREIDSLRSHFADDDVETYVELEFELKGERYIVNRVPKQKKKKARGEGYTEKSADATLTLPDGKVITKVTNVTNKLIETLGITRDQFKQIVMLPQGEFKKLLLADSVERESIFRKIFNTYDFEKIQTELKEKALTLSKNITKSKEKMQTNLENIKGEHDIVLGEYVDFPLVIEKLKELIERDNKSYSELSEKLKNVDINLEAKKKEKFNIDNNNKLIKEKEEIIKSLEELLNKKEYYEEKQNNLTKAKNAKEVKHIEDKLVESEKKLLNRQQDYKLTSINLEKLQQELQIAIKNLNEEENKESEREKLTVEINKLKEAEPKILEFDDFNNKLERLNKDIEINRVNINKLNEVNEKLKATKVNKETTLKEITSLETKKVELENEINNKSKTIDEIRELFKVITSYEKSRKDHFNLGKEYEEFEKDYLKVKDTYETMDDLYKKEQAGILASKLIENKPCPVCGSTHHPNPATMKNGLNIPTKEELKIAKNKLDELEPIKSKKVEELTVLNSQIKNYLEFVNNNLVKFKDVLNIEAVYSKDTYVIVREKGTELKSIIDKLKIDLSKLQEKISLKEKIEKETIDIEKEINENDKKVITFEENDKEYTKNIAKLSTKIEEYKKDIPKDITNINILKNIIYIKTKELDESKKKLLSLRDRKDNISKALEGENSKYKEIEKSIKELNGEIENINVIFESSIKEYGFDNINSYNESKLNIPKIEVIENEVKSYNDKLTLEKSKQEDIINKTKEISFIDVSDVDNEIKTIIENKNEIDNKIKSYYSILENNKSMLENVESLNIEFKEIEEEYKIVGELSDLANGRKSPYISFERYILASYFEDIIDAANIRLEKMTGDRFSLIRKTTKSKGAGQKGLELEIYDNYTDSSRDVSSLSGGESFKASLSLALGLSDVVQANAGGVSLDTMFVDEGFGTLDPQSLDNAIDSLLELQRGGRLVGIISHVEELKERIDAKLEVVSTSKGSKAEFNIL